MNVVQQLNQFNIDHIIYNEPIKNTVIDNSKFIRLITSDEDIIINGVYLYISLKCNVYNNVKEQKQRFTFDKEKNLLCISLLNHIEEQILYKCFTNNKDKQLRLSRQLDEGYIKVYKKIESNCEVIEQSENLFDDKLKQHNSDNSHSADNADKSHNADNTDNVVTPDYNCSEFSKNTNTFITVGEKRIVKIKEDVMCRFILKISGIWENEKEYGITYKFIPIEN